MLRGIYRGPPTTDRIHLPPHHGGVHNSTFTKKLLSRHLSSPQYFHPPLSTLPPVSPDLQAATKYTDQWLKSADAALGLLIYTIFTQFLTDDFRTTEPPRVPILSPVSPLITAPQTPSYQPSQTTLFSSTSPCNLGHATSNKSKLSSPTTSPTSQSTKVDSTQIPTKDRITPSSTASSNYYALKQLVKSIVSWLQTVDAEFAAWQTATYSNTETRDTPDLHLTHPTDHITPSSCLTDQSIHTLAPLVQTIPLHTKTINAQTHNSDSLPTCTTPSTALLPSTQQTTSWPATNQPQPNPHQQPSPNTLTNDPLLTTEPTMPRPITTSQQQTGDNTLTLTEPSPMDTQEDNTNILMTNPGTSDTHTEAFSPKPRKKRAAINSP